MRKTTSPRFYNLLAAHKERHHMIQDPNPIDDVELERFTDWLFEWRNPDIKGPIIHPWRSILKETDLKRIWLEGVCRWHLHQMENGAIPEDLYWHHSSQLRITYDMLETMPDFQPTYAMR